MTPCAAGRHWLLTQRKLAVPGPHMALHSAMLAPEAAGTQVLLMQAYDRGPQSQKNVYFKLQFLATIGDWAPPEEPWMR